MKITLWTVFPECSASKLALVQSMSMGQVAELTCEDGTTVLRQKTSPSDWTVVTRKQFTAVNNLEFSTHMEAA